MKKIFQVFLLLFGVMIYSQNTLSVKDGAYGYNTDFKLDIHLATDTAIKALQFDLKYDGDNFDCGKTEISLGFAVKILISSCSKS